MAGFFSLQPQPKGQSNLSDFASGNPGLEHIGSTQTYLDPSQGKGETLHSPFESPAAPGVTGTRGNLMQPTGDQGTPATATGGTSSLTGARTQAPRAPQQPQGVSGTQLSPEQIQTLQTLGNVQQIAGAVPSSAFEGIKSAIKSSADGSKYSDAEIDQFIQSLNNPDILKTSGLLEGNQQIQESLNPSATEGYTLGAGNLDTSWLNEYTGTRSGTTPSALDKFGKSDIMSALGVGRAAVTGDPAQILASLNRAAPNVAKYITDNKDVLKDVGSLTSVLGGAYSLYQGIQSQNPTQIAGGVGQLLQGAGTSRVGLDVLSQLTGASPGAISTAFSAVGGITGAFSFYQAIQNGDPVQAILSAASIYGSLSTVAPSVFTPLSTLAGNALAAVAPELAASLGIGAGVIVGTEAGAIATEAAALGIGTAASTAAPALAAVAPALGVAAIVVVAIVSYISAQEEHNARVSGWWNNPIKGQLYSSATAGVKTANDMLDQIDQAGIQNVPTDSLMGALPTLANSLQNYYATGQGGKGPIRASDTVTGTLGQSGYTGDGMSPEKYTGDFTRAQQRMEAIVDELLKRGVSYEQLGQLSLDFNPAFQSLDMSNPWEKYYSANANQWDTEANQRAGGLSQYILAGTMAGGPAQAGGVTPRQLLETSAFSASLQSPGSYNPVTGEWTGQAALNPHTAAYGGPFWEYMARMGYDPNGLIQQHFDPWAAIRNNQVNYNVPDEWTQRYLQEAGAYNQAFTSGGG